MTRFITAILLLSATTVFAQDAEREIKDIEQQIAAAVVGRDVEFVNRLWADDFLYTGVRGELKSKADIVNEIKSGDLKFDVMKFDDIRVRVFGDAAIATGRATTKGRSQQGEISGEFRYTRVYVKREGAWKLVSFQGTPLAPKK